MSQSVATFAQSVQKEFATGHGIEHAYRPALKTLLQSIDRAIGGTHYMVSPKYLQDYIDEFTWKYNRSRSQIHLFEKMIMKIKRYGQ